MFLSIGIVVATKDNWIESETFVTSNAIDTRAEVAGSCLMTNDVTYGSSVASYFASTSMHVMAGIDSTMVGFGCVATRIDGSALAGTGSGEATCANVTVGASGGSMSTASVLKFIAHLC